MSTDEQECGGQSPELTRAAVSSAFDELEQWLVRNEYAGYDPYDIRGQDWYVKLFRARKVRSALAIVEKQLPPLFLRRILRIERQINAKGMGLIASAYLRRYRNTGIHAYVTKAEVVLGWLASHRSEDYPGYSWGYPFNWHSRIFIPRGTPSIVVTGTVGNAWLDHFELTGSKSSLDVAKGIRQFIVEALNRSFEDSQRLCFSYTPIDHFQVTNASLFGASFLARLGSKVNDPVSCDLAKRSVSYALSQQNKDGSFSYWGYEPDSIVDHYHTGFVLRHLLTVWESLGLQCIESPLERGYRFYLDNLFTESGLPKFTPAQFYPVDIHSFAEALLCIGTLDSKFGGRERLTAVWRYAQEQLRTQMGWYIAGIRKHWWGSQRLEVPYVRWAQAWMLLALATLESVL